MPSLQTIFRAIVMVAAGVVGVKAWQTYGPTNAQLERAYNQLKDVVQASLPSNPGVASSAADPRLSPQLDTTTPPLAAMPGSQPQLPPSTTPATAQTEAPKLLPSGTAPLAGMTPTASPAPAGPLSRDTRAPHPGNERVAELIAKLQRLGVENSSLAPWGNGGLYRFSCSAPLANSPLMTQHFESVAAEPALAVEQVVAKVEAWRVAHHDGGLLRY